PRGWTAADIFNFIGVFPIAKARMTVRRRKVDGSLAYAGLSCSRFLFLLKSRQALRIYQNRKENDNHEAPKEMAAPPPQQVPQETAEGQQQAGLKGRTENRDAWRGGFRRLWGQ